MKERAKESFAKFNRTIAGEVVIQASQTPGIYLLPHWVAPYQKKYPKSSFKISIYNTEQVLSGILNYEAELGFVGSIKESEKLVSRPLLEDKLVLIGASPWKEELEKIVADQGGIYLKDLLNFPFIFRTEGSATRKVFEQTLEANGRNIEDLNIIGQVDSLEGVKNFVRQGLAVSFVSVFSLGDEQKISKFNIEDLKPKRNFYVIYHKDRVFSPTCERFLAFVQDENITNKDYEVLS